VPQHPQSVRQTITVRKPSCLIVSISLLTSLAVSIPGIRDWGSGVREKQKTL
jgi:hypothetical protein